VQLRTELEIDAPPARVWQVLTDFAAYHEWNPFITSIAGEQRAGAELTVTLSPPESREATFRPRVLVCDEPHELRWRGHLFIKGLFDGEHYFLCQATPEGRTRFVHGENFSGFFVKYFGQRLTHVARGFVYMNEALKSRVEGGARGRPQRE
jgi:hypothetical protein